MGVSIDPGRSLGSYTPKLKAGGDISWVCTGPFSGCYPLSVHDSSDGSVVFGHVVTPTSSNSQYTADDPKNQVKNIKKMTEMNGKGVETKWKSRPELPEDGLLPAVYVFWIYETPSKGAARWVRTTVWTKPFTNSKGKSALRITKIAKPQKVATK